MLVSLVARPVARRSRLGGLAWSGVAVVLAAQLVGPAPVGAQSAGPGTLDTTFGVDGRVTTAVSSFNDRVEALVAQPDGKLVAAGRADAVDPDVEFDWDFAVARYNADGSLDPSFGGDGTVTTDFFGGGDEVRAMVRQPDGKLVAAGTAARPFTPETGAPRDLALVRYNVDGSLDPSFGSGGRVTTDFSAFEDLSALALQPDGKLVAVGDVLVRYNADGTLDTTFGTGGRVAIPSSALRQANAVAVQPDGKLVVAGDTSGGGIGLARFNTDGTPDASFGAGGAVETSYAWGRAEGRSLLVRSDGTLLVGGSAEVVYGRTSLPDDFALVRFLPNGSVDWSFGYFGWVVSDFNGQGDEVNALVEQPDGRIVAVGGSDSSNVFRMARYTSTGALDVGFGRWGWVTTGSGDAEAVVRQADGKLVTGGNAPDRLPTESPPYTDFALLRFHAQ